MAKDHGEPRDRRVRIEAIGTVVLCIALLGGYVAWRATRPAAPPQPLLPIATEEEQTVDAAPAAPSTTPLPASIPRNRVALRVLTPDGKPVPINSIASIMVIIEPNSRWMMGPQPKVIERFADGWVYVDESMYRLAKPGMQTDLVAVSATGTSTSASAPYPSGSRRIEYVLPAAPEDLTFGASDVPADVKPDDIAGVVIDVAGKPIEGAKVSFPTDYPAEWKWQTKRPEATSDAAGVFRFPNFGRQHFIYMQVEKPGLATRRLTDVPVGKPFSVHMDDRTRLRGDLTLADGSPAANAIITLVTERPTARRQMGNSIRDLTLALSADANGHYDVPIEPGMYAIRVDAPADAVAYHPAVTIKSGEAVALPPALTAGETLTLHAVDSMTGKPVAGADVGIEEMRPGVMMTRKGSERKTDADGNATWEHLPPMMTTFSFRADGYERAWLADRPPQPYEMNRVRIDLAQPKSTATTAASVLKIQMEPAVRVSGRVVAPDGSPVANATIDIGGLEMGDARYAQRTGPDGRFSLTVPVLQQQQQFSRRIATSGPSGGPQEYAIIAFDQSGHWANALSERFVPKPGDVHEMTLKMTPGGRVTGRVVNMQGEAVSGIEVEANADDGMDRMYYNPRQITDADGRFDLGPMRPATYEVRADTNFGVNSMNPPQTPVTVTVVEGKTNADVTVAYDGPPPPPVPAGYFNYGGNRRIAK